MSAQAAALAAHLTADRPAALDALAREELGIDPEELGGSAWEAAISSFLLFAIEAVIPVIPFLVNGGLTAVAASIALSALGLFGSARRSRCSPAGACGTRARARS